MPISQHSLKPNHGSRRTSKRRGRGDASGRGSFSGRGVKGQKARSGGRRRPGFEGGQTPLVRRFPKLKGFKNPMKTTYQVLNVGDLEKFSDGDTVDVVTLFEQKLINRKKYPVKLLGNGTLKKKLQIKVDAWSASAQEKVEQAGGSMITQK